MRNLKYIVVLVIGGLLLFSPAISAKSAKNYQDRIVWTKKPNSRTGLYTTQNYFVSHGISLGASAMYYFGDVDNEGLAFHGGFNVNNLSFGGALVFGYSMPVGNHCNMRFALGGGTLHGNNQVKFDNLDPPRDDYRKFQSVLIQPAVGVEYYPFSNAGFYIYGGLAIAASIITNYEFYYYKRVGNHKERDLLKGKTFGILPMVQVGLGYSWRLTQSWTMSAEIMLSEGLIDTHYMNLDAFPLAPSQNSEGVALGNSFGKYKDRYGNERIHWNDGWFQVGITVTYRWRNCETCRILNNYSNIRARRR